MLKYELLLFAVIFISLLGGCCMSSADKKATCYNQQKIEGGLTFEKRKIVLHNLNDTGVVNAVFSFQNRTDDTLFIDTVRVSCGCMGTNYPYIALPPKYKGVITIRIDMSLVGTSFAKSAVVYLHNRQPSVLRIIGRKRNRVGTANSYKK